ncbi:MAG TPA: hypothetical protein VGE74_23890, partial [Gemmata sp.]
RMCRDALRGSRPDMAARLAGVIPEPPPPPPKPHTHNKRVMFTCRPHEEAVSLYHYRPPFGLHAYDPRFRDSAHKRSVA